jgi:hypothetical protein
MRKLTPILVFLFGLSAAAQIPSGFVQTTFTVSGVANWSVSASWTNLSSATQLPLLGCVSTFPITVTGQVSLAGTATLLLADTSQICPTPSTWTIQLTCPSGYTGGFSLQVPVTGGGGTENISSQVMAALPSQACTPNGGGGGGGSGKPAIPGYSVQFANSLATAFQGDSAVTINPTAHSLNLATSGVFSSAYEGYISSAIGGMNIANFYTSIYAGKYPVDALEGGTEIPSGSTAYGSSGVGAYLINNSTTTNGSALLAVTLGNVSGSHNWGGNPLVQSATGTTGNYDIGLEIDNNWNGNEAQAYGIQITGTNSESSPPANSYALLDELHATNGVVINDGQIYGGYAFAMGQSAQGSGATASQLFAAFSNSGSARQTGTFDLDQNGSWDFTVGAAASLFTISPFIPSGGRVGTDNYPSPPYALTGYVYNGSGWSNTNWQIQHVLFATGVPTFDELNFACNDPETTNCFVQVPNKILLLPTGGMESDIAPQQTAAVAHYLLPNDTGGTLIDELSILSTLATLNHPVPTIATCGTSTTCANSLQTAPRMVWGGPIALTGGSAVIGSMTAWTSTTSFVCWGQDHTTPANSVNVANTSTSSITITGTGTDSITYECVGN